MYPWHSDESKIFFCAFLGDIFQRTEEEGTVLIGSLDVTKNCFKKHEFYVRLYGENQMCCNVKSMNTFSMFYSINVPENQSTKACIFLTGGILLDENASTTNAFVVTNR